MASSEIATGAPAILHPLGLSLRGFNALIDAHGGRVAFVGKSTDWVKANIVLTTTTSSYMAKLKAAGSPDYALATIFISHAYSDEFLGVVDTIDVFEKREGVSCHYYYVDLLVVNQHGHTIVPFEAAI